MDPGYPAVKYAPLLFVTGAPGAGKSAVAHALLDLDVDALVFDGDWLLQPASDLAGRSVAEAEELWPVYDQLWVAILEMVMRNRQAGVLFTPMEPRSLPPLALPGRVAWCLLDCDDEVRIARLKERGWESQEIEEAIADAEMLRGQVELVVNTSRTSPGEAAAQLAGWINARVKEGHGGR